MVSRLPSPPPRPCPAHPPPRPPQFEFVGDVLVIPADRFTGPAWEGCGDALWRALAAAHGATRVARKAEILRNDPKRKSNVKLLLGADGRVQVRENGILFRFDLTRLMFCSGNVTEKMRYASFAAQGETVVDLYAGMGYYTLPLLVHAGAAKVHACEWNDDACDALLDNLNANGVADRCTVHRGDNAKAAEAVGPVAHRVSLGLLPTSAAGYATAAAVLNRETGGWLHVHENVHRAAVEDGWTDRLVARLQTCFDDLPGGGWVLEARHVSRVKSYAPRVDHVVVDVECRPGR